LLVECLGADGETPRSSLRLLDEDDDGHLQMRPERQSTSLTHAPPVATNGEGGDGGGGDGGVGDGTGGGDGGDDAVQVNVTSEATRYWVPSHTSQLAIPSGQPLLVAAVVFIQWLFVV